MKRREFFEKAGIGSVALASSALSPASKDQVRNDHSEDNEHDHGDHKDFDGPLSSATVSFGQWNVGTDRFPNLSPRANNNHQLIPSTVEIKAGGCVNFIISGYHYLLIYDNGIKPADIDVSKVTTTVPPLITDADNRIYRGLDPSVFPVLPPVPTTPPPNIIQDRIEVVRFPDPGKFLVICGVLPHFYDPATGQFIMFGYVRVKR